MSEKKTKLPLQRKQDWKIFNAKTEKKKKEFLTHIYTKKITELKELIYAVVKLVCENIGFPFKNTKGNSKRRW